MPRHNNFDALRLVAAVSVMFSHAFLLTQGTQRHEWLIRLTGNQAILGYDDSPAASAETITDFQDLKIGVAAGTTSLNFVTDVLMPTTEPFVFNDNAAAKQALDTQQIDAIVADLPTALYISAVEIEGTTVFGQFPPVEGSEGEPWGMLFAKAPVIGSMCKTI